MTDPTSPWPPGPRPTKEQLRRLVDALAEPVGPWVLAGYGGELARLRHQIVEAAPSVVRGVLDAQERIEAMLERWAADVDPSHVLDLLLEIAMTRPNGPHAAESPSRPDDWEQALGDLLVAVGRRDAEHGARRLRPLVAHPSVGRLVDEVLELLDERSGDGSR
ncbi:MAG: hypothetical protein H6712_26995 [Myxococcales bacterium]|nr:hypothetical protein [Myxococcales bacterium]MCB9717524.1 hypothetical protein [Myxococcales bacterium]